MTRFGIRMALSVCAATGILLTGSMAMNHRAEAAPVAESGAKEVTLITMTAGNAVIAATLDNSQTSRDFIASLPVTMKMTRWGNREYYGKVKNRLSEGGQKRNRFENGDVAYWAPGGSFAVFFNDKANPDIADLIVMGKVTSDLSVFDTLSESLEMRIDLAK